MPKINSLLSKKVVIGVGIDNASSVTTLKPGFSSVSTSFGSNSLSKCDLTLPSSTFTESIGTFLNMESRRQVTDIAFKAPKQAQKNTEIIETFSNFLEYPLLQETINFRYFQPEENKNSFLKASLIKKSYLNKQKVTKVSIKGCITDFYNTNAITKNSKIMAECSALARKNFTNFI